jgi:hypothetical protein
LGDGPNDAIVHLGTVSIPLDTLARDESACGRWPIMLGQEQNGILSLSMLWTKPYKLDVVPIVSLLDQPKTRAELSLTKPVHQEIDTAPKSKPIDVHSVDIKPAVEKAPSPKTSADETRFSPKSPVAVVKMPLAESESLTASPMISTIEERDNIKVATPTVMEPASPSSKQPLTASIPSSPADVVVIQQAVPQLAGPPVTKTPAEVPSITVQSPQGTQTEMPVLSLPPSPQRDVPQMAIDIKTLRIFASAKNPAISNILDDILGVQQIFVSYDFLHFPSEDLESGSVAFQRIRNDGPMVIPLHFKRGAISL